MSLEKSREKILGKKWEPHLFTCLQISLLCIKCTLFSSDESREERYLPGLQYLREQKVFDCCGGFCPGVTMPMDS